jgi:hypothetical protein
MQVCIDLASTDRQFRAVLGRHGMVGTGRPRAPCAHERLRKVDPVRLRGPLAVIAQWSEICAYRTAVTVEPVSDAAKVQHAEFGRTRFARQEAYSTNVSECGRT